ncbi:MAG: PAS domain S-box protein, partial [Anaerolineales bacterium]
MDWQLRSLRSLRALRGFMPKTAFRSWKQWAAAAAGYAGLYLAWLLFLSGRSDWRAGVGYLAVLLPRLLAGGLAFSLYKNWWGGHRAALDPRVRQAWGLTGLALLLWLAGDLTRLAYEIILRREAPVPSFADPVYLTGYFFAAAGLFSYPILPREHFGRIRFLLDMAITSAAAIAVSWLVLIRPILITAAPSSPAEILWTSVYPLADLALLLILLNVSLGSGASPSPSALSFVAFGLAAFLVADLAFTYLVLQEEYVTGSSVSLGWVIGNCLFGLGALFQVEHPNSPRPASNNPHGRRLRHRIQAWLPLAATVALGWYTFLDWRATGQADVLSLWATALLGLALIARQGVIIGEVELQHYAHLVNNAADPAFICGPNGRLRLVNPALLSAIGYDHQEALLDRPLSMLLALSTLHPEEDLRPERLLETGWSGEVTLHRRNGTEFPAYLSLRPVHS